MYSVTVAVTSHPKIEWLKTATVHSLMVSVGNLEAMAGKVGLCFMVSEGLAGKHPLLAIGSQTCLQRALSEPLGHASAHTHLCGYTLSVLGMRSGS